MTNFSSRMIVIDYNPRAIISRVLSAVSKNKKITKFIATDLLQIPYIYALARV